MKRQSDIGWFELIMGSDSDHFRHCDHASAGWCSHMDCNPVWSDSRYKWNRRHCPVCEDGTIYRFRTGRFSGDRNPWNYGRIYADRTSGSRHMGNRNDSSNLDHCTLHFQTFPSPVYEDALRNDLLYNFTDFEHSGTDRRNPSDLPSDDHDFIDGCFGRCIPDYRGSRMYCSSLYRRTLLQIKTEIITKMKYTESSQLL